MSIIGSWVGRWTERSGRKFSLLEMMAKLESSGEKVHGRFQSANDNEKHREAGRHIIGIERWSQSRLRVVLGTPLTMDEYDSYQPGKELDMAALSQLFGETRQESLSIARQIQESGVAPTKTVPHNELGELSVSGWLFYIENHAWRESVRLR